MLSVLRLGTGPNLAGARTETQAEPETAVQVVRELTATELAACPAEVGPRRPGS